MHVAATYDGTTIRLYINGVQEGSDLAGPAAITHQHTARHASVHRATTRRWFNGLLDDARVSATALSASEVLALYNAAPTNSAPVAVADSYSTAHNTALVQAAPGVLANDTDADANPLTAIVDTSVSHGSLTLNANGGFTYTPTTGYSGPDSFTYHASDGTASSNVVTVSLTVGAPANPLRGWWTARRRRARQLDLRQPRQPASAARPSWPAGSARPCRSTAPASTPACPTPTAST